MSSILLWRNTSLNWYLPFSLTPPWGADHWPYPSLPKPPNLSETVPRETIVHIYFFHVQEKLIRAIRNGADYLQPYSNLPFYADLSQYTILKRKNLSTVTNPLYNHQIPYKWGHPVKLVVIEDNRFFSICSLDEGLLLLRQWKILDPRNQTAPPSSRNHNMDEWNATDSPDKMTTWISDAMPVYSFGPGRVDWAWPDSCFFPTVNSCGIYHSCSDLLPF